MASLPGRAQDYTAQARKAAAERASGGEDSRQSSLAQVYGDGTAKENSSSTIAPGIRKSLSRSSSPPRAPAGDEVPVGKTALPPSPPPARALNSMKANSVRFQNADVNSGKNGIIKAPRIVFKGHKKAVLAAAVLTVPGKDPILVSGGEDKNVCIWSVGTGELIACLRGHVARIASVAVHVPENGKGEPVAISGSWDETVRIWPIGECFTVNGGLIGEEALEEVPGSQRSSGSTRGGMLKRGPSLRMNASGEPGSGTSLNAFKVVDPEAIEKRAIVLKGHKNRVYSVHTITVRGKEGGGGVNNAPLPSESFKRDVFVPGTTPGEGNYRTDYLAMVPNIEDFISTPSHPQAAPAVYDDENNRVEDVVLSGSADNSIRVWNMRTGTQLFKLFDQNVTWMLTMKSHVSPTYGPVAVVGCKDNTMRVWGLKKPEIKNTESAPIRVVTTHTSRVECLDIHPNDGSPVIITTCRDYTIRLFDLDSGDLLRCLEGHTSNINAVSVVTSVKSGTIVASASDKGNIRLWNFANGENLRVFNGHTECCNYVTAFLSPEREVIIVSCSNDTTVRTWLYAEEKALTVLEHGTKIRVKSIVVYAPPDVEEAIVITGCNDCYLRAFRLHRTTNRGVKMWEMKAHEQQITSIALYEPPPFVFELAEVRMMQEATDRDSMRSNNSSKGGKINLAEPMVISGSRDSTLKLWKVADGSQVGSVWTGHLDVVTAVTICLGGRPYGRSPPASKAVASATGAATMAGALAIHRRDSKSSMMSNATDFGAVEEDGTVVPFVVSGSEDNELRVWKLSSGECMMRLTGHEFDVTSCAVLLPKWLLIEDPDADKGMARMFSLTPDDPSAAASAASAAAGEGGNSSNVRRHSLSRPNKSPAHALKGGKDAKVGGTGGASAALLAAAVAAVAQTQDEDLPFPVIVSGSMDSTVRVWSYPDGVELKTLGGNPAHITCVAVAHINDKGPIAMGGGGNGDVKIWSLQPPFNVLTRLEGHTDEIQSICFAQPEGMHPVLATGSWDMTVRVWNLEKFQFIKTLEGHKAEVSSIAIFSPGGADAAIASASSDTTVRVLFDFLGNVLKDDAVRLAFQFDLNATNSHVHGAVTMGGTGSERWPRMSQLVKQFGPEQFFGSNYKYFFIALNQRRPDFITAFLPLTRIGLVKSNNFGQFTAHNERMQRQSMVALAAQLESPEYAAARELRELQAENAKKSLLRLAIDLKESAAIKCVVQCWVDFLGTTPTSDQDLVYEEGSTVTMDDMLHLAAHNPREFQLFITGLRLIPAKGNALEDEEEFLMDEDGKLHLDAYEKAPLPETAHKSETASVAGAATPRLSKAVDALREVGSDKLGHDDNRDSRRVSVGTYAFSTVKEDEGEIEREREGEAGSDDDDSDGPEREAGRVRDPMAGGSVHSVIGALPHFEARGSRSSRRKTLAMTGLDVTSAAGDLANNVLDMAADNLMDFATGGLLELVGVGGPDDKRAKTFKWLPLNNPAHMSMLKACADTCEKLDNPAIFDSEAGKLLLSFAWRSFGKRAHVKAMLFYFTYVAAATVNVYIFEELVERNHTQADGLALFFVIFILVYNCYFIWREVEEILNLPLEYFSDIWNQIDFVVIFGSISGNIIRLVEWKDTDASRCLLALSSIMMWFNLLYYLRAFESTGPLVSMVLRISQDMQPLILVLLFVIVGFSQAFWLLSRDDESLPFGKIDRSFLNSFSFMLGGYDPEAYDGLPLESFAIFLSCVYMLIGAILLLNLLIALMGDSYADVKAKGLAQWRLEQAQLINELGPSLSKEDYECERSVYLCRNTDEIDPNEDVEDVDVPAVVTELKDDVASLRDEIASLKELLVNKLK